MNRRLIDVYNVRRVVVRSGVSVPVPVTPFVKLPANRAAVSTATAPSIASIFLPLSKPPARPPALRTASSVASVPLANPPASPVVKTTQSTDCGVASTVLPLTADRVNELANSALGGTAPGHIYAVKNDNYPDRPTFFNAVGEALYREWQHTPFCLWHSLNAVAGHSLVTLALARQMYHLEAVEQAEDYVIRVEHWRKRNLPGAVVDPDCVFNVGGDPLPDKPLPPNGFYSHTMITMLQGCGVECVAFFQAKPNEHRVSRDSKMSLIPQKRNKDTDCAKWLDLDNTSLSTSNLAGLILHHRKGPHFTAVRLVRNSTGKNEWHHLDSMRKPDVGSALSKADFRSLISDPDVSEVVVVPVFDSTAVVKQLAGSYPACFTMPLLTRPWGTAASRSVQFVC